MPLYLPGSGPAARDNLDVLGAFPVTFEAVTPSLISGNLMTLDMQRGVSGWTAVGATVALNQSGGADGGGRARATFTAVGSSYLESTSVPVVAGTAYTGTWRARCSVGSAPMAPTINWFNASNAYITTSTGTTITSVADAWMTGVVTATAPAGAAFARLYVGYNPSVIGVTIDVSVACLRTSATVPASAGVQARCDLFAGGGPIAVTTGGGTGCLAANSDGTVTLTCADASPGNGLFNIAAFDAGALAGKSLRISSAVQWFHPSGTASRVDWRIAEGSMNFEQQVAVESHASKRFAATAILPRVGATDPVQLRCIANSTVANGARFIAGPALVEVS